MEAIPKVIAVTLPEGMTQRRLRCCFFTCGASRLNAWQVCLSDLRFGRKDLWVQTSKGVAYTDLVVGHRIGFQDGGAL